MATYWITFRIHDDGSYNQRYSRFIDAVNEIGSAFWEGPTSFIALETSATIDDLAVSIARPLGTRDLLVIREIGKDNTRYVGDPGEGFEYFFPRAKKL